MWRVCPLHGLRIGNSATIIHQLQLSSPQHIPHQGNLNCRYYLLGLELILCLDTLQWLNRMKDTNGWIICWYLALQPFKFKVIHRPVAQMAVADFLSSPYSDW